jgi:hypothetical protein
MNLPTGTNLQSSNAGPNSIPESAEIPAEQAMSIYSAMLGRKPTIDPAAAPRKPLDLKDRVGQWMADTLREIQTAKDRMNAARAAAMGRSKPATPTNNGASVTLVGQVAASGKSPRRTASH